MTGAEEGLTQAVGQIDAILAEDRDDRATDETAPPPAESTDSIRAHAAAEFC
jgi:hypothetical protein